MLFLNIMLSVFVSFADTVNVSKQHLLQEVTVVASRTMNKGNKIIVQMREDENKTWTKVLASVPHVAVTESGISIDGRGKVKVLLNGHEVRNGRCSIDKLLAKSAFFGHQQGGSPDCCRCFARCQRTGRSD